MQQSIRSTIDVWDKTSPRQISTIFLNIILSWCSQKWHFSFQQFWFPFSIGEFTILESLQNTQVHHTEKCSCLNFAILLKGLSSSSIKKRRIKNIVSFTHNMLIWFLDLVALTLVRFKNSFCAIFYSIIIKVLFLSSLISLVLSGVDIIPSQCLHICNMWPHTSPILFWTWFWQCLPSFSLLQMQVRQKVIT